MNITETKERMLKNISDKYDKSEGSFFYDAISPCAIEMVNIDKKVDKLVQKFDISNLTGLELEKRIEEKTGIKRKKATKASGHVLIKGSYGAVVNIGDKFSTDTLNFKSLEKKTIEENGTIVIKVECEIEGRVGNVPRGAIKKFPITISGLSNVTNEEEFKNGYDEENDKSLLQRYFEHIHKPSTSGNKYDYIKWAKEISGVGDAKVFSLWNGDNTVKAVIVDMNKQPVEQELVNKVQKYIDPDSNGCGEGIAPIGAFCTVVSASSKILNILFKVIENNEVESQELIQNIRDNISNYIKDEVSFQNNKISYNKIGSIILNSKGVEDFKNLTINGTKEDILIGEEEVPVIGVIDFDE